MPPFRPRFAHSEPFRGFHVAEKHGFHGAIIRSDYCSSEQVPARIELSMRGKLLIAILASYPFVGGLAPAQQSAGALEEQIADPSGGAIPSAQVTVRGARTGLARTGSGSSRRSRSGLRAECFNLFNQANLRLRENDLASPAFGHILEAAPATACSVR
jgi:hypothetical protein